MDTGWIAAVGTLPPDMLEVLEREEPPEYFDGLEGSEAWAMIYNVWAQFAVTFDPTPLGNLHAFVVWARARWNVDEDGGLYVRATVADVREAHRSFFQGITTANKELIDAMAAVDECYDADDDDATQLGQDLSYAAFRTLRAKYDKFRKDMADYGARAAHADSYADDVSERVRAENQRVVEAIPDRQYTDLAVYNWGGTILVCLGENHNKSGLPAPEYDGYIAKRRARIGPGEWVVSDPGEWMQWVAYEMSQLGSKKEVVVGDPQKYDAWDG